MNYLEQLTYDRQEAIDVLLRLMGCTDAKSANCEHVAAIGRFANLMVTTSNGLLVAAPVHDVRKGRALTEERLIDLAASMTVDTHIKPGVSGHREGRLTR